MTARVKRTGVQETSTKLFQQKQHDLDVMLDDLVLYAIKCSCAADLLLHQEALNQKLPGVCHALSSSPTPSLLARELGCCQLPNKLRLAILTANLHPNEHHNKCLSLTIASRVAALLRMP